MGPLTSERGLEFPCAALGWVGIYFIKYFYFFGCRFLALERTGERRRERGTEGGERKCIVRTSVRVTEESYDSGCHRQAYVRRSATVETCDDTQ